MLLSELKMKWGLIWAFSRRISVSLFSFDNCFCRVSCSATFRIREKVRLVKKIRQAKAGAVFTEPQYPGRVGQVVSGETGIPAGELDPVASGPADAPLNYYEIVMRRNMRALETLLGVRK